MQGQRSVIGSLPEGLGFDHDSSSSDAAIDHQQIFWNNNTQNPAQNRLSDYISPGNTSDMYLNSTSQEGQNLSVWSTGEPSSSALQNQGEQKTEHGWSSLMKTCAGAGPSLEPPRFEPASTLSLDDVNINVTRNQIANNGHSPLFMQSSSGSDSVPIPQDVNINSSFVRHDVVENLRGAIASSSSDPCGLSSETDGRPRKRKALELNMGQSSESGNSNFYQRPEGSVWHAVPSRRNANNSLSIPNSSEDILGARSSEQIIPRLGLGIGGIVASENRLASSASGSAESTHRNIRLRINASRQESVPISNNLITTGSSVGQSNHSSPYPPTRLLPLNNPVVDNSSSQGQQPVLRVPALRRNLQVSRWNRSSSSRPGRSSHIVVSGDRERETASHEESNSRSMPRNISEHPIFMPATEIRIPTQNAVNWSLTGGNNISSGGNVASSSRTDSSSGVHPSSAPNWAPHRNPPHYPRRLSEFVRRSLLPTDSEAGGQINNAVFPPPSGTSGSSQEVAPPSVVGIQGRHLSHSRSAVLLDRQLDGAFGLPYLSRGLAAASEGRNRLVSEIRNVLDLMRRGEGLRFEDVMILDQSVFYGMPDIHDRHRDMRLDIDNMSYEELLALEERIGNVNTGLTEETISKRLKQKKFMTATTGQLETEPCCICQEEYDNGDDLGGLECGHDFHTSCIKQWLLHKNLCPICKSAAFAAT